MILPRKHYEAVAEIKAGEEMFPAEFVEGLLEADSLVREWRTYRGLSQEKLAEGGHCPEDCGGIGL